MNRSLAKALSVLFHPLLLPTYLFYLILYRLPESAITFPADKRWIILTGIFIITFFIPALGTYMMVRAGVVQSMEIQNRAERRLPLLFTAVCYAAATFIFQREGVFGELLYVVMLLITLSVLVTYVVSLFWKISAHSVGMGGLLGGLLLLHLVMPDGPLFYYILLAMVLCGAVMSARLALGEHSPEQVYAGFLSGLSISGGFYLML